MHLLKIPHGAMKDHRHLYAIPICPALSPNSYFLWLCLPQDYYKLWFLPPPCVNIAEVTQAHSFMCLPLTLLGFCWLSKHCPSWEHWLVSFRMACWIAAFILLQDGDDKDSEVWVILQLVQSSDQTWLLHQATVITSLKIQRRSRNQGTKHPPK